MKTRRTARRLEWDILESRRCPSQTQVFPAPDQPVERSDALAVTEHGVDLAAVATGQASNVVFLGDSITQWFQQGAGASVWSSRIEPLGAADLGVAGDLTNNLLWRVENGELAGQPKVAVLMIGTNNLGDGESVAQTVACIEADIAAIHAISPRTEVLLNGLFPRGLPTDPLRAEVLDVNAELSTLAASLGVVYSDPGASLVTAGGSIGPNFLTDLLHPDASGYEIWANGVVSTIEEMLSPTTTTPVAPTILPLSSSPQIVAAPDAPEQASPASIAPATTSALALANSLAPGAPSPTQGTAAPLLAALSSVASAPPAATPPAGPSTITIQPVVVGHSLLLRVAQSVSPATKISDSSADQSAI